MHEQASPNTIRMFHEMMKIAEGQDLQEVKDAVCNMLASIIVGHPSLRSIDHALRHEELCRRDVRAAVRANWERRKLHAATQ